MLPPPSLPSEPTHPSPLTSSMASSGRPRNQTPVIAPHSTTVSASCGCCDKWPPTWWLKTTHLLSPSPEGQRSEISFPGLKSRCEQWCFLLRLWGENHFLAFFSFHSLWPLPWCLPSTPLPTLLLCHMVFCPDPDLPASLPQGPEGWHQVYPNNPE